jgi:hypothetical protein
MSFTNGDVAKHAYELAEGSRGRPRMAALCVSVAAATTDSICRARAALEIIPHSGLRQAAQTLLAELADGSGGDWVPAPEVPDGLAIFPLDRVLEQVGQPPASGEAGDIGDPAAQSDRDDEALVLEGEGLQRSGC